MWRVWVGTPLLAMGFVLIKNGMGAYGDDVTLLLGIPVAVFGGLLTVKGGCKYLSGNKGDKDDTQ
jgi:hypothetical protein